eukprot:1007496-Amphidinium_carterae.2
MLSSMLPFRSPSRRDCLFYGRLVVGSSVILVAINAGVSVDRHIVGKYMLAAAMHLPSPIDCAQYMVFVCFQRAGWGGMFASVPSQATF